MMRYLFLCFLILTGSLRGQAAEAYSYQKFWNQTKMSTEAMKYSVYVKDSPISVLKYIASMTVTENNKDSIESVLRVFKNSIGPSKWTQEHFDSLDFYETLDVKTSTLFRIAHNSKTNQYSVGAVKTRFLLPSYLEIHLLQVEKLTGKTTKSSAASIYKLLVPEAQAQSITNSQVLGIINSSGTSVTELTSKVGELISTGNNVAGAINNNAAATNNTAGSINNLAESGNNVAGGVKDLSGTVGKLDSTLKNTFSTKTAAELAAAAALSSTIVTAMTTFVLNGTWDMAKRAFRELNGSFSDEEINLRLNKFQSGMKNFEKLSPDMVALENKITLMSIALSEVKDNQTSEEMLKQLNELDDQIKTESERVEKSKFECDDNSQQAGIRLKNLKELRAVLASNPQNFVGNTCEQVDSLYKSWLRSEYDLSLARKNIVENFRIYMGVVNESTASDLAVQEQRKQTNACIATLNKQIFDFENKTKDLGCGSNPETQSNPLCRSLKSLQSRKEDCNSIKNFETDPHLQADLDEAADALNSNIKNFSETLNKIDCSVYSKGQCTQLGSLQATKKEMKQSLEKIANRCPNQSFAKSAPSTPVKKIEQVSAKATATPDESSQTGGGLFSWLQSKFKSFFGSDRGNAQELTNAYAQSRMIRGT